MRCSTCLFYCIYYSQTDHILQPHRNAVQKITNGQFLWSDDADETLISIRKDCEKKILAVNHMVPRASKRNCESLHCSNISGMNMSLNLAQHDTGHFLRLPDLFFIITVMARVRVNQLAIPLMSQGAHNNEY